MTLSDSIYKYVSMYMTFINIYERSLLQQDSPRAEVDTYSQTHISRHANIAGDLEQEHNLDLVSIIRDILNDHLSTVISVLIVV